MRKGQTRSPSVAALKPEFIADFIAAHHLSNAPEAEPFSRYPTVLVSEALRPSEAAW